MPESCWIFVRCILCSASAPWLFAGLVLCASTARSDDTADSSGFELFERDIRPLLERHCYDCHGNGATEGGISFDAVDVRTVDDPKLWERVLKNVRAGLMPPPDQERLSNNDLQMLQDWIKIHTFHIDLDNPDPGHATLRRLNRNEYRNTILDLFGHDFDVSEAFPPDNTGEGFDNIGSLLMISPLLMEKYMLAAREIVRATVPSAHREVARRTIDRRAFLPDGAKHISCREPGRYSSTVRVETSGEYIVRAEFTVFGTTFYSDRTTQISLLAGPIEIFNQGFGWQQKSNTQPTQVQARVTLEPGDVEFVFDIRPDTGDGPEPANVPLAVELNDLRLEGPLDRKRWVTPANYERWFPRPEAPRDRAERRAYAADVLRPFLDRAFRRPVDDVTLAKLIDLAANVWQAPDATFEEGIQQAMTAALCSRRFLFHTVRPPAESAGERFPLVDEFTLAARLSYLLWDSLPDDRLVKLAQRGELRAQLDHEIRRMVEDPKSERFVESFIGQWLRTREVDTVEIDTRLVLARDHNVEQEELAYRKDLIDTFLKLRRKQEERFRSDAESPTDEPEPSVFEQLSTKPPTLPAVNLDESLRQAMRAETEMLFSWVLHEDRSLLEFLDSDFTFLNERLAAHYGIEGIQGLQMRRVALPDDSPRGGLLGHAGLLMITSQPTRTSAVKRGVFVLDNLLGTPAPPAPPDIPPLEEAVDEESQDDLTLREMLEWHRRNPNCASCHQRMDPIGLALENYNALGQYRDQELGHDIDVTGELATGEQLGGLHDLRKVLASEQRSQYYRCVTEKLLIYALGRGLDHHDTHTVDTIVERLEGKSGQCSALLTGIIRSAPFQRMRSPNEETP